MSTSETFKNRAFGDAQTLENVVERLRKELNLQLGAKATLDEVIQALKNPVFKVDGLGGVTLTRDELEAPSSQDILRVCVELAAFLMRKNKAYGDSALKPVRMFSKVDTSEQIKVRMDDKISRMMRGEAAGEDPMLDLVGYWVLLKVLEKRA